MAETVERRRVTTRAITEYSPHSATLASMIRSPRLGPDPFCVRNPLPMIRTTPASDTNPPTIWLACSFSRSSHAASSAVISGPVPLIRLALLAVVNWSAR